MILRLATACVLPLFPGAPASVGAVAFSTGGHTLYHLAVGNVGDPATRDVIGAAFDGTVVAHTADGTLMWKAQPSTAFPFDLCTADLDGDPLDEVLVAYADGSLRALDDDGSLLWSFATPAPLYQVTTARLHDGRLVVLAGGIEQVLYALSPDGQLRGKRPVAHVVRHLRAGQLRDKAQEHVAMATTDGGLNGELSLHLLDPADLTVVWHRKDLGTHASNSGKRFFSMSVGDLDHDGLEDVVMSHSWGDHGRISAWNGDGQALFDASDPRIPNIPYRMNRLIAIERTEDAFLLGLFGNVLIAYGLDGSLRQLVRGSYSFADGAYDPHLGRLYLGSSVSGGDGLYAFDLTDPAWPDHFRALQPVGRLAGIERNLEVLRQQIRNFERPAYQPAPRPATVLGDPPPGAAYTHLRFVRKERWSQRYENREETWSRHLDRRREYRMSADELDDLARGQEDRGEAFVIWSGHGHAVYFPLETFRRIAEAAPTTLYGFVFAEMERIDEDMQAVFAEIIQPLADLCLERGLKIVFRNKNIFWNGSIHEPFLRNILLDRRYREVLVPGLEETNSRTQELSLAGRVGLWKGGYFADWSCRMVTDNANWDRMWEWGGQQIPVHHLRHLVSRAAMGARIFFPDVHQGPFTEKVSGQLEPFYEMLERGIIHLPTPDELLSVPAWAIGMVSPPDPDFLRHGTNGHGYHFPQNDQGEMVFDRLDSYWGAAPLLDHDVSRYLYGLERRQCNFLPSMPYGLVPIVPADLPVEAVGLLHRILPTDGVSWFDDAGQPHTASSYRDTVLAQARAAADRLPVRVEGGAHWSAARLGPEHIRLTLMDPGYLDPAPRRANIRFPTLEALEAVDILSRERLEISPHGLAVDIPAGIFRIIDLRHAATQPKPCN